MLVTGGTRGIGKACVELFLKTEASVAFTYFSAEERANEIVREYGKDSKIKSYKAMKG